MGKKGAKGKGKPVVMSQAEFFQSQAGGATLFNGKEELKSEWGKTDIFAPKTTKSNVVVASKVDVPIIK